MTERWRKRLSKLDDVSPSDDVLERAKSGPQLPDEMIPRPKATTRVATAIAAFVVFALAISVFAIPALRMREGGAGTLGTAGIQPLWPWHSISDVESFTVNPQAIGDMSASDVDQPDAVAAAFGRQVLGWGDRVWAHEEGVPTTYPCGTFSNASLSPIMPTATDATEQCVIHLPYLGSGAPTVEPWVPSSPPPALRTFSLSTCEPNAICDYTYPGPGDASVVMYQPLGSDGPWAVLEAQSQFAQISVNSAVVIKDGELINSRVQIPTGYSAELAIHAGEGDCAFTQGTAEFKTALVVGNASSPLGEVGTARLEAALSPRQSACPTTSTGYALAAVAGDPLRAGDSLIDPMAGGGPRLFAFAAVPLTLIFPEAPQTPTETPTQVAAPPTSPTVEGGTAVAVALGTYTDQLGWTIDVPETWKRAVVDNVFDGRTTSTGAWFSSGAPQVLPGTVNFPGNPVPPDDGVMIKVWHRDGGPAPTYEDDSPFPLSPNDLQPEANVAGAQSTTFRGDGLEFQLEVQYGQNADIGSFRSIVDYMIGSIAFQPWQVGDTRNGFTALESPRAATQWVPFGDTSKRVIMMQTATGYVALGPVTCDENGTSYTAYSPNPTCPDSLPLATWDASGQPDPNNAAGFQHPLAVHPVIKSWDGVLLSSLDVTIG